MRKKTLFLCVDNLNYEAYANNYERNMSVYHKQWQAGIFDKQLILTLA